VIGVGLQKCLSECHLETAIFGRGVLHGFRFPAKMNDQIADQFLFSFFKIKLYQYSSFVQL